MPTMTKEKEQRKQDAKEFKAKAYGNLAALIVAGRMTLQEGLQWWQSIQSCRSLEDAQGIWTLLETWIRTQKRV
jgi:hypothetical protein